MSLLRSLIRGCLFFYKDVAPTELKQKKRERLLFFFFVIPAKAGIHSFPFLLF